MQSIEKQLTGNRPIRIRRGNFAALAVAALLLTTPSYGQRGGRGNPGPANPFAGNEQAIEEGRDLYNRTCTACHGFDGTAGDRGPALGAPGRRYLRNSDYELFDAISKGIPGTQMPAMGLAENDAWKVAGYVHGLRGTAIDTPARGDVAHGEQVFWGKGQCGNCHMMHGKGGLTGPDLSNVANQLKLFSIRDSLTKPDYRPATDGGRHQTVLVPLASYKQVRVITRDGRTIQGVVRNEDSFSIQILGTDNALHSLAREDLREIVYEPKSLMPADFDKKLTPDELQDLLAFLSRQGKVETPAPAGRGGRGGPVE
jgi:putative heme-binding domain-containing protein